MSSSVVWLLGHAHTCACIGGILRLYLGESYSWLLWPKASVDDLLVWSQRGSHMACSHSPTHREDRWHSTAQGFPVTKEVHPRRNKNWSRTYIHHVPETLCCVWTTTYRTLIHIQILPKHIKYHSKAGVCWQYKCSVGQDTEYKQSWLDAATVLMIPHSICIAMHWTTCPTIS